MSPSKDDFRYPSYVQDIMGDIFSLGFGPFRWCVVAPCASPSPSLPCAPAHKHGPLPLDDTAAPRVVTSGKAEDLRETDRIAAEEMRRMMERAPGPVRQQLMDNLRWIEHAEENRMVVGSQARILYADCEGRANIALAFNQAIKVRPRLSRWSTRAHWDPRAVPCPRRRAASPPPSCCPATTTTCRARTPRSARPPTSPTAPPSPRTWRYRTRSETPSAAPPGSRCTTAVASAGARL